MSTITPINSTDPVANAPTVIDTNFNNLNTDKLETLSNVGSGTGTLAQAKSGTNQPLKTIKAGSNVTITNNTNEVQIDVSVPNPDASSTVKGLTKLSVDPASPTSPIAVGDNDARVPTQNENDALVGTSGTAVSSSNKLVDNADTDTAATAGKVVRRITGGQITVPSSPSNSTDAASKAYVDNFANKITDFITIASSNIHTSDDADANTSSTTPVKLKEILFNDSPGTITVSFALQSITISADIVEARVYKNGVAFGTDRSNANGPTTYTENLVFATGDLIQIYASAPSGSQSHVTNFRLSYDKVGKNVTNTINL
jgi:hypothetical protein